MAATRVQAASAATTGTTGVTSLAVGATQGWAAPTVGNLIVAWANANITVTTPTGFTAGPGVLDGNDTHIFYKVAAGTETTITFPFTSADLGTVGCLEYSGIGTLGATPPRNTASAVASGGTSSPSVSVTGTGTVGDLFIVAACNHAASAASMGTPTWTGGVTNVQTVVTGGTTPNDCGTAIGEFQNTSAAALTTVASWTGSYLDRQALVIAFLLSSGGPAAGAIPMLSSYVGPG
jgi:hypothetical protein